MNRQPPFHRGNPLRAAELQALSDDGRKAGSLRVAPPLTLRATAAGRVLSAPAQSGRAPMWARLVSRDESGKYAWQEVIPPSWSDGPRSGTADHHPAFEANGRSVPDDEIVRLRPGCESPPDWRFRYQRALPQTVPGRICLFGCNGLQLHAPSVAGLVVTIDGLGVSLTPGASCLNVAVTPGVSHSVVITSTWFETYSTTWDGYQDLMVQLTPKSTYRCCSFGPRPWPTTLYCETPWGTATLTASGPTAVWYGEIEGTETTYTYPGCTAGATVKYGLNLHCMSCVSPGFAQVGWCFYIGAYRTQCGTCADGTALMVPIVTTDPQTVLQSTFARGLMTAYGGGSTLDMTFSVGNSGIGGAFCGINYNADFAGTYVITE